MNAVPRQFPPQQQQQAQPQAQQAQQAQQGAQPHPHQHHHPHRRLHLGDCETEDEVLDLIEQSRRVTRLIISAVQKGSNFEVSQILEHYGMPMTSRLHFKVVNIVMEQWFSLIGIEDEEKIWNILRKNEYAMDKIRSIAPKGTLALSDLLGEWELPIGALQSKIIRRITDYLADEKLHGKQGGAKKKQQQLRKNKVDKPFPSDGDEEKEEQENQKGVLKENAKGKKKNEEPLPKKEDIKNDGDQSKDKDLHDEKENEEGD